ncbi:MAG: S8 family peptidase [Acidobacteria bacterium]|nr:S8 family peptidase [Acidobacteriota bacterium]
MTIKTNWRFLYLITIIGIVCLLPIFSLAQTLREFAQGRRGELHRRMATDLLSKIEAPQSKEEETKIERLIVNSASLANANNTAERIARLGGRMRQVNRSTGTVVIEIPRQRVAQLLSDSTIDYISPDRPVTSTGHLENTTGAAAAKTLAGLLSSYDGSGIGIAVIDSGVDSSHELLNRNLISVSKPLLLGDLTVLKLGTQSTVVYGKSFVPFETSINDPFGHGTMIASLISGRNGFLNEGFTGIAPGAQLINLRVLNKYGSGRTSDVIAAIDWCISNKAAYNIRIINLSLGAPVLDSYKKDPLCLAARRAFDAGIVVVTAAGNYGKDIQGRKVYGGINSPGIEPSVITVGATNTQGTDARSDDSIATYSSRGPTRGYVVDNTGTKIYDNLIKPEIVAPGNRLSGAMSLGSPDNVLVQQNPSLKIYPNSSSFLGTKIVGVMQLSGTSVAAPVVSGTIALMLQANPNLPPSLVKSILMYSAQQLPGFNTLEQGAGEINAHGAVSLAKAIRTDVSLLKNGDALLRSSLPSVQASLIAGKNAYWSQAVIHRYGFFHGARLMTNWQGMYRQGVLPTDAISYLNGAPVLRSDLVINGVASNSGIVFADGTIMADGNTLAEGIVFADGTSLSSGEGFVDGRIIFDPLSSFLRSIFPLAIGGE